MEHLGEINAIPRRSITFEPLFGSIAWRPTENSGIDWGKLENEAGNDLTGSDKRELKEMVLTIEKLEAQQGKLMDIMADEMFFKKDPKDIAAVKAQLETIEDDLLVAFERWEELEEANCGKNSFDVE